MAKKKKKGPNNYLRSIRLVSKLNKEYQKQGKTLYKKGEFFKAASKVYKKYKSKGYNLSLSTVELILVPKETARQKGDWDITNPKYASLLIFDYFRIREPGYLDKLPPEANIGVDFTPLGIQGLGYYEGNESQIRADYTKTIRPLLREESPPPSLGLTVLDSRNKFALFEIKSNGGVVSNTVEPQPIATAIEKAPEEKIVKKKRIKKKTKKQILALKKEKEKNINKKIKQLKELKKIARGNKKLTQKLNKEIESLIKKVLK